VHGAEHLGVLAHAEIVVAAPDGYRTPRSVLVDIGGREGAAPAQQIGKDPISAFALQFGQNVLETGGIRKRHVSLWLHSRERTGDIHRSGAPVQPKNGTVFVT
jgi:hypothetical protein